MRNLIGLGLILMLIVPAVAWGKIGGSDVTYRPKGADAVLFSHDSHVVKSKTRCSACHYKLYTTSGRSRTFTMADMEKGQSCGACHNGQKGFPIKGNCKKCHK
ncbi:MAG: cytochrome c3 family protein [Nitrospirota bacterium]